MKTLFLTCGLPRAGKSTWARTRQQPIVCPDAIRLSLHGQAFYANAEPFVWAMARLMVASLFEAGHDTVILDACNVTQKWRDEWIDSRWVLEVVTISTPKEVCIERAHATGQEYIIPIIELMAAEYEPPSP